VQLLKLMRTLTAHLESDRFEIGDFGRQQLKQMLSAGPFVFLSVPVPQCVAGMSEDAVSHIVQWNRDVVQEVIAECNKVWEWPSA
jgi:hypothetical protein